MYSITADMKDETDIIARMYYGMAASPIGWVVMIVYAETFKTDVIVLSV